MSQDPPAAERVPSPWRTVCDGVLRTLSPLWDFLFPPTCLICGQALAQALPALCDRCRRELCVPEGARCQRCAAPAGPHLDTSAGCVYCREEHFAFRRVLALGVHEGLLRQAILRGKHPHGAPLIAALTDLFLDLHIADLFVEPFDVIVPVPHDWRRRFWRLHNPAETIADRLSRRLQRPLALQILRKPRATPSQASSPPSVRRRQQRGAFEATATCDLSGTRVLLVDDVLTTGATANAAAKALRLRQVADVSVVVLARGIGRPHTTTRPLAETQSLTRTNPHSTP